MKRFLSALFVVVAMSAGLFAQAQGQRQSTPPEVEAERLRIQAEERARREAEQRDWETRIFPVRYIDPSQLQGVLSMFRSAMQANRELRVLSVRAPKEIMPAIEDAIKRLDVAGPRRDADLTVYVLLGSNDAAASNPTPAALQPVVTQLKNVLQYKSYEVVDTLLDHITDKQQGYSKIEGSIQIGQNTWSYFFNARAQIEIFDGKPPAVRLGEMMYQLRPVGLPTITISGDVEVPQGQQVIVGKSTMGERAIILVMTSKFPN